VSTTKVVAPNALSLLEPYLVPSLRPLLGRETVQLLLAREVLDYTVLRTEETRELNTVTTTTSATDDAPFERVAFLATKQKGAESRELGSILRTLNETLSRRPEKEKQDCYLKASLCGACPRCALFGSTNVAKGGEKGANLRHRIGYGTAFSIDPAREITVEHTFNGVSEATQRTGQTLGSRNSVAPGKVFPSIVTLRSVTERELVLALKTILSTTRYGAEARVGGQVRNTLVGVVAGWEEVITSLELTLGLQEAGRVSSEAVCEVVGRFKPLAAFRDKVRVLTTTELDALVEEIQTFTIDKTFLDATYDDVAKLRKAQEEKLKREKE
jgi:CRISPR type I-D-associated protein Csc2